MRGKIKLIKYTTYVLLLLIVASYGTYQFRGVVWGPQLSITSPKDGAFLENGKIKIEGQSTEISSLFLNGRKIFTDEQGYFQENILLLDGLNLIEVKAIDKMDRVAMKQLQIVYKLEENVAHVEEVARLTGNQL